MDLFSARYLRTAAPAAALLAVTAALLWLGARACAPADPPASTSRVPLPTGTAAASDPRGEASAIATLASAQRVPPLAAPAEQPTLPGDAGPTTVVVPVVYGMTESQARRELGRRGLVVSRVEHRTDDTGPPDMVVGTVPAEGTPLPPGSRVVVVVAVAPAPPSPQHVPEPSDPASAGTG